MNGYSFAKLKLLSCFFFTAALLFAGETNSIEKASFRTLSDLEQALLDSNPILQSKEAQLEVAKTRSAQEGTLPDPEFTYTWWGENVETRVGPQEQIFAVRQGIPWPGKLLAAKSLARANQHFANEDFAVLKSEQLTQLHQMWAEFQIENENIRYLDSDLVLLNAFYQTTRAQYESGQAGYLHVVNLENKIAQLKNTRADRQDHLQILKIDLGEMTGLYDSLNVRIDFAEFKAYLSLLSRQVSEIDIEQLIVSNPDFLKLKSKKNWSERRVSLQRQQFYPDLMVGFNYVQTGENPGAKDSGKDPWSLSLGISIPLQVGKRLAALDQAHWEEKGVEWELKAQEEKIKAEWQMLDLKLDKNQRQLLLIEETLLPNLIDVLQISQQDYVSQKIAFADLLNLFNNLWDLRIQQVENYFTKFQLLNQKARRLGIYQFPTREASSEGARNLK